VALARAPESRLDRLEVPAGFGSVVVDSYGYGDAEQAYERLREVARSHHLVLLSADDPVFRRVRESLAEFPQAEVVERGAGEADGWLDSDRPTRSYDDSLVRAVWRRVRGALDGRKVPTGIGTDATFVAGVQQKSIAVTPPAGSPRDVSLIIAGSFHPNWLREDGERVYLAAPFFMLTFVSRPTVITFDRTWKERAGLYASGATLLVLLFFTAWGHPGLSSRRESHDIKGDAGEPTPEADP
jgi:hypothetical protein